MTARIRIALVALFATAAAACAHDVPAVVEGEFVLTRIAGQPLPQTSQPMSTDTVYYDSATVERDGDNVAIDRRLLVWSPDSVQHVRISLYYFLEDGVLNRFSAPCAKYYNACSVANHEVHFSRDAMVITYPNSPIKTLTFARIR